MALIPLTDPTLEALDIALEAEQKPYVTKNIGFGVIGHHCRRKIWYDINRKEPEKFSSNTLRIFRNGHIDEDQMAADLRKIPGVTLLTHDPDRENKQYKVDNLGGRFTGRLDGLIIGLIQAPLTWNVWEHKSVNQKKFDKFNNLKSEKGEKFALKEWDEIYYSQAQSNMFHTQLDRHYLTVSTPGLRQVTSARTELDQNYAEALIRKAQYIIEAKTPPDRITEDKEDFVCRYCVHKVACHGV